MSDSLTAQQRENLTNYCANAAKVTGITAAAVAEIVKRFPELLAQAVAYDGDALKPIDPLPTYIASDKPAEPTE